MWSISVCTSSWMQGKLSALKMWLSSVNLTGRLRPWISNVSTDLLSSPCLHSRTFHLVMTRSRQGLNVFFVRYCSDAQHFLWSSLDFFFKPFFCVVVGGHLKANNRKQKWISSGFNAYLNNNNKKNLWILKTWKCLEVFLQWEMKELCSEEVKKEKKVHMLEKSSRCFF